jgi:pilus assembly protein Flp/PilA
MKTAWNRVKRFLVAQDGPTAVQYALLLLLAILTCLTIITAIGQRTAVNTFAPDARIERPAHFN